MKKLKQLLVIAIAAVFAFSLAACDSCSGTSDPDLTSISVDTTEAKTEYYVGEDFSSDGIVVTAAYSDETTATITEGYTVDSSAYDKTKVGSYDITVTYGEMTSTYSVAVYIDPDTVTIGGLKLSKTTTEYTLASTEGFTLDTSDLTVTLVTDDGESSLSASDCTVVLAKDGDFYEDFKITTEGVYQVWVYYDYTVEGLKDSSGNSSTTFTPNAFLFVYVLDTLESITLNTSNEDAVYTQSASTTDSMSSTWTYTATFASGATKQLTAADVAITGLTTTTATDAGAATVSYTFTDAKGTETIKTCTVNYTITAVEVAEGTVYTMTYAATGTPVYDSSTSKYTVSDGSWATTWGTSGEDALGTVSITTSVSTYGYKEKSTEANDATYSIYAEVKKYSSKGIQISVGENATDVSITVYASHTSKDSSRTIYLGTETTATDTTTVLDSYTIVGDSSSSPSYLYTISKDSLSSGTYYVFADDSATVHVYAIVVSYSIGSSTSSYTDVSIDMSDVSNSGTVVTVSGGSELISGTGVYICGASTTTYDLNSSEKAVYDGGVTSIKYAYRLKIGGAIAFTEGEDPTATNVSNGLKIDTLGAATITVYVRSSSSRTDGTGNRTVALYDASGTQLSTDSSISLSTTGDYVYKITFTVSASGSYYFGSTASGIGIYAIIVSY